MSLPVEGTATAFGKQCQFTVIASVSEAIWWHKKISLLYQDCFISYAREQNRNDEGANAVAVLGEKSARYMEVDMDSGIISEIIAASATILGAIIGGLVSILSMRIERNKRAIAKAVVQLNAQKKAIEMYIQVIDDLKKEYESTGKVNISAGVTYQKNINKAILETLEAKPTSASRIHELTEQLIEML